MAFLPSAILATILLFSRLIAAQKDNGNECSCFRTNGTSAGYFTSHQFFDYRNVDSAFTTIPSVNPSAANASGDGASSDFFTNDAFTKDWAIQTWNNSNSMAANGATVLLVNSMSNVYIEQSNDTDPSYSTYLSLRTARLPNYQSAAEIDSVEKNYHYVSARFFARVIGSPGACAGIFTYLPNNNPQKVQESDIEILTSDPRNAVQYTNQPSVDKKGNILTQATANISNPGSRDWTQWNVYRVDWMPKMTSWYVNGESVANISFQAPKDPSSLIINMWSDGGSWTGNMSTYDEAYLQIQWIEIAYNTSGPFGGHGKRKRGDDVGVEGTLVKRKGSPGCKIVCGIDEQINTTGTPALIYNNSNTAPLGWRGEGMGTMVWVPLLVLGATVFGFL